MKIGIRAALQALLEADDQIGGKTLGESALTLVRRHRTQTESARTMCNGLEAARAQLAEAHQSEARALAERDKVWAQFRGLGFEFDDLLKERDALAAARDALEHQLAEVTRERDHYQRSTRNLSEQQDTFVRERDAALAHAGKVEAQLATAIAQYNATTITLADMRELAERDALRAKVETLHSQVTTPVSIEAANKRPQPGDQVAWSEVEDGCLYADTIGDGFLALHDGRFQWVWGSDSLKGLEVLLVKGYGGAHGEYGEEGPHAILVARGLGSDPEQWREAMRAYLQAKGNPTP